MLRIKITVLFACVSLLINSCVKPFKPDINSNEINKYVVIGQLDDQEGFQEVQISLSSPVDAPELIPVKHCTVFIIDDKGNNYSLEEYKPGYYHVWMSQNSLTPGTAYKVEITTADGTRISSAFDRMPEVPEVDNVYYQRKDIPTNDPNNPTKGIQFYIDYIGNINSSPFVKWDLVETWEYHTAFPFEAYYDGELHINHPFDYSRKICWKTTAVDNIFTLSTQNLNGNKYKMFPLHFVDNHTSRLAYGYSLLIKQYALSESAYLYWDKIRINHNSNGGLYQQQPLAAIGNLVNETRPDEKVLGYFNASAMKTKRIFIHDVENLEMDYNNLCGGTMKLEPGWQEGATPETPFYLVFVDNRLMLIDEFCFDCLLQGGTNVKPDFWPN